MKSFASRIIFSMIVLFAAMTSTAARAASDQFWIFDGPDKFTQPKPEQKSNEYGFDYFKGLNNTFSVSAGYGNQGHDNIDIVHHTDYLDTKIWAGEDLFNHNVRIAFGAGLLYYYDTTGGTFTRTTEDLHGFGSVYSASITLKTFRPFLFQVRSDFVNDGPVRTRSLMLGLGYQIGHDESDPTYTSVDKYGDTRNEVEFYGDKTTVNLSGNGHSNGFGVEYRRDLSDHIQWTEGFMDEGKSDLGHRFGVTSELWLVQYFRDNRFSIGAAGGLYAAHNIAAVGDATTYVTPMGSITAAFKITPHLVVRLTWDRVEVLRNLDPRREADSDVGKFGIGYAF